MTEEDEEFNRIEREAKLRMEAVSAALERKAENARELGLDYEPAQQPAVPDAIHHTDLSETLEYIQGWNDCRQAMLAQQPAQQEPDVDRLVALARADEREACAKVCDELPPPDGYNMTEISFWDVTSLECAAAIRARSET